MFVNTVGNPLFKQVHYEPTNSSTPMTFPTYANIAEKVVQVKVNCIDTNQSTLGKSHLLYFDASFVAKGAHPREA